MSQSGRTPNPAGGWPCHADETAVANGFKMGQQVERSAKEAAVETKVEAANEAAASEQPTRASTLGNEIQSDNLSAAYLIIVGDRVIARRGDLDSACNLQHELYEEWTLRKAFTESDEGPVLARVLPRGDFETGRRTMGKSQSR